MKAKKSIALYRRMREQPMWRLLASDTAPEVIGIMQTLLLDGRDLVLPSTVLHERVEQELEALRLEGGEFPPAQQLISRWVAEGYLERRLPAGAKEEEYELSTAAVDAIRFLSGFADPHAAATESRLAIVMSQIADLDTKTDADRFRRLERLEAERDRIEAEIKAIHDGALRVLPDDAALERLRDIVSLAQDLAGDFKRVRDRFDQLNRELRRDILENDGSRGQVLDKIFSDYDLIGSTEEGRTFDAFWRLLVDPVQASQVDASLSNLRNRSFVRRLGLKEQEFLWRLMPSLLDQGGQVHEVLHSFSRGLKQFVQSKEYLEHRRLNQLLQEAQRLAGAVTDTVHPAAVLDFVLDRTSARVSSISQDTLYDPGEQAIPKPMEQSAAPKVGIDEIGEMVGESEIDMRELVDNVRTVLAGQPTASVGEVLRRFPATQGLGSVVGLISLCKSYGVPAESGEDEQVSWKGNDGVPRKAWIPGMHFVKEREHDLVQSQ